MPRLPAGQTAAPLRRFGLPVFAAVRPNIPARPTVTVTGAVRHPTQLEVSTCSPPAGSTGWPTCTA
jgi:hypothetical protein